MSPEFKVEEMVREKLFCATLAMTALRVRLNSPDRQIVIPTCIPQLMRTMWTPRTRDNQKLRNRDSPCEALLVYGRRRQNTDSRTDDLPHGGCLGREGRV